MCFKASSDLSRLTFLPAHTQHQLAMIVRKCIGIAPFPWKRPEHSPPMRYGRCLLANFAFDNLRGVNSEHHGRRCSQPT